MTEINKKPLFTDDNINDIFDKKMEVGAVIQFNLLQRLIEEFISRYQSMNDKINNLDKKISYVAMKAIQPKQINNNINNSAQNLDNTDNQNINSDSNQKIQNKESQFNDIIFNDNINFNDEFDPQFSFDDFENNNDLIITDNNNNSQTENKIKTQENNNNNKAKINEKTNVNNINQNTSNNIPNNTNVNNSSSSKNNNIIPTAYLNTIKTTDDNNNNVQSSPYKNNSLSRLEKLEIFIRNFTKKVQKIIVDQDNTIDYLKNKILIKEDNSKIIDDLQTKVKAINATLNDINIFELFKTENTDNSNQQNAEAIEENTNILKVLSKNFKSLEKRNKLQEEELIKLRQKFLEHAVETRNLSKTIENTENNFNNKIKNIVEKYNNELEEKLKLINENKKDIINLRNAVVDLEEGMKKRGVPIIQFDNSKINNEKLNNLILDSRNYINNSLADTEKYIKSLISKLNVDKIKKDLNDLTEKVNSKLITNDFNKLNNSVSQLEKKINDNNIKIENYKKDISLCNDTCTKTVNMIEYLSGQVIQSYQPDVERIQKEEIIKKNTGVDLSLYVGKKLFYEELTKVRNKIDKTFEIENENYKFMQHLEDRLKYFATENDLRNMERCFNNLIDEVKEEYSKKFMEKLEATKSFKYLEMQVKHLIENTSCTSREKENWLLAKKPINNYSCASCETYLGDVLKEKSVFVPWNKVPNRDEKKYRMGNGFSKMLQLINFDLMKSAEKLNSNLNVKVDEKKTSLPRIGSQLNIKHLNNPNMTFSLIQNNDVNEQKMNNSADFNDDLGNHFTGYNTIGKENYKARNDNKENDSPKVIKIVKKNMKK